MPQETQKAAQARATREKLIAVAFDAFSTRGYACTATEDIVKTAGLTRGALYHHFKGKADLFYGVFCHAQAELGRRIEAAAERSASPWEELVNGCLAFLEAGCDPGLQQVLLIDGPAVLNWEAVRRADAETQGSGLALLKDCLRDLLDQGAIIPLPLDAMAHLLSGAMDEASLWIAQSVAPDKALDEAVTSLRVLLEGLKTV